MSHVKPRTRVIFLALMAAWSILAYFLVLDLHWIPRISFFTSSSTSVVVPAEDRLTSIATQTRFSKGLMALEAYRSLVQEPISQKSGQISKMRILTVIGPLVVFLIFFFSFFWFVCGAGPWRHPRGRSITSFIGGIALSACLLWFTMPFSTEILTDFLMFVTLRFGGDCWPAYLVWPMGKALWTFLAVAALGFLSYGLAIVEMTIMERRVRLRLSLIYSLILLFLFGGIWALIFAMRQDGLHDLVRQFNSNNSSPAFRTSLYMGYSGTRWDHMVLAPESVAAVMEDRWTRGGRYSFIVTPQNLEKIHDWIARHPLSLNINLAYHALAVGYLTLWDIDQAYAWFHRSALLEPKRIALDITVLRIGPIKHVRKVMLHEWGDPSKWVFAPTMKAKLAGILLRYGDRLKAEGFIEEVLKSGDQKAIASLTHFLPPTSALNNGVLKGCWDEAQPRPRRVGLFRMMAKGVQEQNKMVEPVDLSQFLYLIDSTATDDKGCWSFGQLQEGKYALGFLFESTKLSPEYCVDISGIPHAFQLSRQNPMLDLTRMQIRPCKTPGK